MAQLKGDINAVNAALTLDCVDHFGSADVNGAVSITLAAGATGTVVLEVSAGQDANGVDIWVQIAIFCDMAGVSSLQSSLVGAAGAQHGYAEIVGARKIRARKSVTAGSCYTIINLKAA